MESNSLVVGRDPASDVMLTDQQVSRRHLRLYLKDNLWYVEDLRSSNGTLLNGRQVREEIVQDGDIILMGETMIGFHLVEEGWHQDPFSETQTITIDEPTLLKDFSGSEDPAVRMRASHDLEALYRVGRRINGILKVSQLIPVLLDMVFQEIKSVQRASVFLYDAKTGSFDCRASRERNGPDRVDPQVFSNTMAKQVLKEDAAVLTYDALTDERFSAGDSVMSQGIRAAICAPLQFNERILGVLYADSSSPRHRFTRDDLRLVAAIGLYAGAAIENAQLYERLAYDKAALHVANQELMTARDQLVQSEKLAAVGRLASGIVHDMKNPMTVILGYAGMVRSKLEKGAPGLGSSLGINNILQEIEGGVEHVNGIISQLLSFAKPSMSTITTIDVLSLVKGTVDFLKHETTHAGVTVTYRFPADLPRVQADANKLKQVFMNLILNGVQAMEGEDRRLTIGAEIAWHEGGRAVAVSIEDNGKGMTPEERQLAFEPFYTTKKESDGLGGTGLGLSTSYGIVKSHGGRIDVESVPGEGTTFRVVLPVSHLPPPPEG